jgi:hypothetical protein
MYPAGRNGTAEQKQQAKNQLRRLRRLLFEAEEKIIRPTKISSIRSLRIKNNETPKQSSKNDI